MKRIITFILVLLFSVSVIIPINALGSPVTYGAYNPPPSPSNQSLTASYSIMRSYADVTSVLIGSKTTATAIVNDTEQAYYLTAMFNTPNTMVAPNNSGFGTVSDYAATVSYFSRSEVSLVNGNGASVTSPSSNRLLEAAFDRNRGNALVYSFILGSTSNYNAYQYGTITGEWINGSSFNDIVTGYAIKWYIDTPMTVSVIGKLVYGVEGRVIDSVNIDRSYNVPSGQIFEFNPQTLLEYEDTVNFDYYVFTGNWTVSASYPAYLVEYKSYDSHNVETVDYINNYNEYTDQVYSFDLNPITRITSKLSTTVQTPTGILRRTLTENGTFTYDVSQYAEVEINTDVPQEILEDVNAFNWLFGAVNGFLQMEILPGFSLGGIVLFIAGLALLIWILKIFLGG